MQRFTTSDGIGIAYRTWADDAVGPPVLLHHGFIANAQLNWVLTGVVDALVAAGRRLVVLADHTKWGTVGLSTIARLGDADVVISDEGLSEEARAVLAEHVEDVRLVPVEPPA